MAIDPSIPLRAQAAPPPDLFGSLGQIIQLRGLQQREESARRQLEKERQYEALAQQYGDDPEAFTKALSQIDPLKAQEFARHWQQARKEQFSAYDSQLKSETAELEAATRELQAIPAGDISRYAGWRSKWTSRNAELNQVLPPPEQFTPETQQQLLGLGQSTTEFLKAKQEGIKAFLTGDYRKGLGNTLAVAPSMAVVQQTLEEAKRAIPKSAQGDIALFEGLLANSPDLATFRAQAAEASMTAKERADIEGRKVDDLRQAEQFENTKDYQAAQLAISRGHLGVSQAQLGLSRQRLAQDAKTAAAAGSEVTKLPAAIAEKVAGVEQSMAALGDLERLKKDEWLGPINGRMSQARISVPGASVSPELGEFAAQTATLKNAVIKATTGAAMSEPEAKRIMQQIPDFTDKPEVWKQKAITTKRNMELLRRRMLELSGVQQGAPAPSGAPAGGVERWERGPDGKMRKVSK